MVERMKAVPKRLIPARKRSPKTRSFCAIALITMTAWSRPSLAAESLAAKQYRDSVQPVLTKFCYDCHADGANKGGVAFDEFKSDALLENRELWWTVMKYLRAGIMPPEKKPRPTNEEKQLVETWIKAGVFGIDPANLDPGRVTLRRLNRVDRVATRSKYGRLHYSAAISAAAFSFDSSARPFLARLPMCGARPVADNATCCGLLARPVP